MPLNCFPVVLMRNCVPKDVSKPGVMLQQVHVGPATESRDRRWGVRLQNSNPGLHKHCLLSPPGEEDSQVSVDAVTESETSCPPATTGTENGSMKMGTWVFMANQEKANSARCKPSSRWAELGGDLRSLQAAKRVPEEGITGPRCRSPSRGMEHRHSAPSSPSLCVLNLLKSLHSLHPPAILYLAKTKHFPLSLFSRFPTTYRSGYNYEDIHI
jgi:hypothetical protein